MAIGPVMLIIIILHLTVAPMPLATLLAFIVGAFFVIFGLSVFLSGVDLAIVPSGSLIGASLTRTRNLPAILISVLVSGFIITLAEPNLNVQGDLVQAVTGIIPSKILVMAVALGTGLFLMIGMGRVLLQIPYKIIILISYAAALLLASKVTPMFVAIAFDSSGASTGPLTVPFFMALGLGLASVRGGKSSNDDSFGTTGIAAIGPILAVAVLAFIVSANNTGLPASEVNEAISNSETIVLTTETQSIATKIFGDLWNEFIQQTKSVSMALSPLVGLIILFQFFLLKIPKRQMRRIIAGLIYAWIGLVLFFTGANTGFIPTGTALGEILGSPSLQFILIPLGCVLGALIVTAEPAMWVLTTQVEEVSSGNIRKPVLLTTVALGVAIGVGLAMWRVVAGFNVWYLIAPTFILAVTLTFFTPKLFATIAFDSGSVATGPVSSTLILPLTLGAALASGGNPATDGFGLIAMIAVMPPISIQILGFLYHIKEKKVFRKERMELDSITAKGE